MNTRRLNTVVLLMCCILYLLVQKSSQQCSSTLSLTATNVRNQNYVNSPNYANDYDKTHGEYPVQGHTNNHRAFELIYVINLMCRWFISSGSGIERVVIEFIVWSLEENYDYVTFYDGGSTSAPILARHSGTTQSPYTIRSTGRFIYVYFFTDYSVTRTGFRFTYYSEYSVPTSTPTPAPSTVITTLHNYISVCDAVITLSSGDPKYISSPNWPYTYSNNLYCRFYIATDSDSLIVKITVQTMHTQRYRDVVYIYDDSSLHYLLAELSGSPSVPSYYSTSGKYMSIAFSTDASTVYSGFTMMLEAVSASIPACVSGYSPLTYLNTTASDDYLQSPNYPANYDNNYLEYWLIIKVDETQTLIFDIISFRLETHSSCDYDSLKIYYGACETSGVLYYFCDHKTGYYTHTYGRYALVKFTTDSSVVNKGFKFRVYLGEYRGSADISTEKSTYDDSENGIIVAAVVIPIVVIAVCVIGIVCKIRTSRNRPAAHTPKPVVGLTATLKSKVEKSHSGRQKKNVVTPQQPPPQPPLQQQQMWMQPATYPPPSAPPVQQFSDPAYPPIQSAYMPHYNTSTPQASSIPNPFEYRPYTYS